MSNSCDVLRTFYFNHWVASLVFREV